MVKTQRPWLLDKWIIISSSAMISQSWVQEFPPSKNHQNESTNIKNNIHHERDHWYFHKPAPYKETVCIEKNWCKPQASFRNHLINYLPEKHAKKSQSIFLISMFIYLWHAFQHHQMVKVFFLDFYIYRLGAVFIVHVNDKTNVHK